MNSKGASEFITAALLIMFGVAVLTLTVTVVKPALDRAQDSSIANEAMNNLRLIDNSIKEVAAEEKGAKRTLNIKSSNGLYQVDTRIDYLNFTYDMNQILNFGGSRDNINVTIERNTLKLFVVYNKIDLIGSAHIPKGAKQITIKHEGTNTTNSKPIVNITS